MSRWPCLLILFLDLNRLPKTPNNEISTASNFDSGDHTHFLATPFLRIRDRSYFCNSTHEGPRDFSDTANCLQWPYLYKCYESTYALKRLFFAIIAKNWFWVSRMAKIGFLRFSQKVSILRYIMLHNSNINMAIAVILLLSISLYDAQEPR